MIKLEDVMKLPRQLSIPLLLIAVLLTACGPAPTPDTTQIDVVLTEGVQTMVASYFETQTAMAPTATATVPSPTVTLTQASTPIGFLSTLPPTMTATLAWIPVLPSSTATVTGTPPTALPTALASGCKNLAVIGDATVVIAGDVLPGSDINATWSVQNTGSCDWESRYVIQRVGGACPEFVGGYPDRAIPAGKKGTISAKIETPHQNGTSTCSYRLSDGKNMFGATMSVTFTIKKPVTPVPPTNTVEPTVEPTIEPTTEPAK
jgi:hypothetical protein